MKKICDIKILCALTALLLLSACSKPDKFNPLVSDSLYLCDNARTLTISIGDKSPRAIILYDGRSIPLYRIETHDGIAYSNNIYSLYYKDELAFLEYEDTPLLTHCRPYR